MTGPTPVFRPGPLSVQERYWTAEIQAGQKGQTLAFLRLMLGRLESPTAEEALALDGGWIDHHAEAFTQFMVSQMEGELALRSMFQTLTPHADRSHSVGR